MWAQNVLCSFVSLEKFRYAWNNYYLLLIKLCRHGIQTDAGKHAPQFHAFDMKIIIHTGIFYNHQVIHPLPPSTHQLKRPKVISEIFSIKRYSKINCLFIFRSKSLLITTPQHALNFCVVHTMAVSGHTILFWIQYEIFIFTQHPFTQNNEIK